MYSTRSLSILALISGGILSGLFANQSLAQVSQPSTEVVHPSSAPLPSVEVVQPSSAPVPTMIVPLQENTFHSQFGLGFTVIPAYQLWFLPTDNTNNYPFQGGLQLDFLLRVHPHITLEFSIPGTGAHQPYGSTVEVAPTFGFRAYPRTPPKDGNRFHLAPYFAFDIRIPLTVVSVDNYSVVNFYEGLGAQLGFGLEFRINSHVALSVDVRGVLQIGNLGGLINRNDGDGLGGIRAGVGFAYYF